MKPQTMPTLRCLIIDDESAAHKTIQHYISKVPGIEFSHGCMNAVKALEAIATEDFDIIFLDVDMPYISGVQFLDIAGKLSASVIMTTAHAQFAIDGFDHNVTDYLLKPFGLDRFLKAVHKVRLLRSGQVRCQSSSQELDDRPVCDPLHPFQLLQKKGGPDQQLPRPGQAAVFNEDMMWIRVNKTIIPVEYKDLCMIQGDGNYVVVYTKGIKHLVRTSLTLLVEQLPEAFIRTHKSYIINRYLIQTVSGNEIIMSGDKRVAKISRYLRAGVLKKLGPLYG